MYRRPIGRFNHKLELLRPSAPERDEMGGLKDPSYTSVGVLWAMQRDKTSTYRQVIGDYVTMNTSYFIARDCTLDMPLTVEWRIRYEGYDYIINSISKLMDTRPYFIEIEATKLGGNG